MQSYGKYVVAAALGLTATSNAWALEEFYATPGSRAMAMGGAFAAFAADSSSIWYNPAGLGFQSEGTTDFTIEFGDVVTGTDYYLTAGESQEVYDADSDVKYVGISTHGFGVAYFRPYRFSTFAYSPDSGETALIETEYDEVKFGFGFPIMENFSFGATLDVISRAGEIVGTTCPETSFNCADESDLEGTSMGATLGALYKTRIIESSMTDLQLSAVYRTDTFAEEDFAINEFEAFPARPTTMGFGAALRGPITFIDTGAWGFYTTITAQYDLSEFEEVIFAGTSTDTTGVRQSTESEFTRTAFGLELQIITPQNLNIFLRAGQSSTDSDGGTITATDNQGNVYTDVEPYTNGISSTSYGIGISFGSNNQFVLDYAMETRDIESPSSYLEEDEEVDLQSVSFSFLF